MNLVKPILLIAISLLSISCASSKNLTQIEAENYCNQHDGSSALSMNPLGEEYATWMKYCHASWLNRNGPILAGTAAAGAVLMEQSRPKYCYGLSCFNNPPPTYYDPQYPCDYPWQYARDGSQCGDRAASVRAGGRLGGYR